MDWLEFELTAEMVVRDLLVASAITVVSFFILVSLRTMLVRRAAKLAEQTSTIFDDAIVETLAGTKTTILALASFWAGAATLELPSELEWLIPMVCGTAILIQVGLWANTLTKSVVKKLTVREGIVGQQHTASAALGLIARMTVWTIIVILILANAGVEISGLVAGLGVGGVAAALAVQAVLKDVIAAFSLYFDRPFDLGDFIIVGDFQGTVDRIGLRSTRIVSLSGEQLVFANSDLADARLRNYRRMRERRIVTRLGVTYDTSHALLQKVPALLQEAVDANDALRFDRAHFCAFGAYALEFEMVHYVLDPDYGKHMDAQQTLLFAIHRRFEEEGLIFAFPTQTLEVRGMAGEAPIGIVSTRSADGGAPAPVR